METARPNVYFPGLNGLRFIAAFMVIINHIETAKYYHGYENYMKYPFLTSIGGLSVTLFFVLSGFLITYLLMDEKQSKGSINIKKFYKKRILRIWPLYFVIVILSLFIINKIDFFYLPELSDHISENFKVKLFLFLIILPNIVAVVFPSIPYLHHTWSIGVEEQFYLVWPLVIRYVKSYSKVFLMIIIIMVLIGAFFRFVNNHITNITNDLLILKFVHDVNIYFSMLRIGCMAIGGVGAWLLINKKENILKIVYRGEVFWCVIILVLILFVINPPVKLIKHEFYALLFCIIILNVVSGKHSVSYLENKVFKFLGKISYGIYIYHPVVIGIIIGILKQVEDNVFGSPLSDFILYSTTILFTIGIASVSYYFFELRFLKLKDV